MHLGWIAADLDESPEQPGRDTTSEERVSVVDHDTQDSRVE